jgi:chromosome segregation ATPase
MSLFVKKSDLDTVEAKNKELTENQDKLTKELSEIKENSAKELSTIQEQLTAANNEKTTLVSQMEESSKTISELQAENKRLTDENFRLITENEELSKLPGSKPASLKSNTENGNQGNISDLEKVNEFCKKNSDDLNACMAVVKELNL